MSYYRLGNHFLWFVARVSDIKDPEKLGRVRIRVIHNQTGELGKTTETFGVPDDQLLWAWPISAIQSASLNWRKVADDSHPLEGFEVPPWIDAVGMSPTGIAVGTYVFGFYLDGHEQNIPMIFGTYHKKSIHPEPLSQSEENRMLQLAPPTEPYEYYSDVAALARGVDDKGNSGQTLPKHKYFTNKLWTNTTSHKNIGTVDEMPSGYRAEYPYNTTYTTKSGHAIELDDTPGYERIHIWHKSGSYEEISNGRVGIDDDNRDYPHAGPNKFRYRTAGGVIEENYTGRRSRKTVDSLFETIVKDRNDLIGRDHNVEVANTETVKIGNNYHWTVGHQSPTGNRINDNGKTGYLGGGIGNWNSFFDVANNSIYTTANNNIIQVGYRPEAERRLTATDINNQYTDLANNSITTVANSSFTVVSNNHVVNIGNNSVTTVGKSAVVIIDENCHVRIKGIAKIITDSNLIIDSAGGITVERGNVEVKDVLRCTSFPSGTFTDVNGTVITVSDGLITNISEG